MTVIAAPKPIDTLPPAIGGLGHNNPPLDESIIADFLEALRNHDGQDLTQRIDDLVAKAERTTECKDADAAGRLADGIKMMKAVADAIDGAREKLNRPLLTAQRALKAKADGFTDRLNTASARLRMLINAWQVEENKRLAAEREAAEEAARAAQRAALQAAADAPHGAAPEIVVKPAVVEAPVARGDYGAKVGSQTVWKHEILSVRQLPDAVLKNERVVEAINKVLAAQIRGGAREIKGCRIWSEQQAVIR